MGLKGDGYMNYTYILKCRDNSLYTGWTNDIDKRLKAHNDGKGAKYTKSYSINAYIKMKWHALPPITNRWKISWLPKFLCLVLKNGSFNA